MVCGVLELLHIKGSLRVHSTPAFAMMGDKYAAVYSPGGINAMHVFEAGLVAMLFIA